MPGAALSDIDLYWPILLNGVRVTLALFLLALPLAFLVAMPVAAARNSSSAALRVAAHAYIAFFRGVPLLPVLFLLYYGLPHVPGIRDSVLWVVLVDPFAVATLVLVVNSAAFQAEILAGAFRALPRQEVDAARVAGFRGWRLLRLVVAPQMARLSARAYGNEIVFVLKATSIAGFITLQDMIAAANAVYLRSFDPVTPLLVAGLFYFAVVLLVQSAVGYVEGGARGRKP